MKTLKDEVTSLNFWLSSLVAFIFSILFFSLAGYLVLYMVFNPWWIRIILLVLWAGLDYVMFKAVEYYLRKYIKK
jgi:hypothetical protein